MGNCCNYMYIKNVITTVSVQPSTIEFDLVSYMEVCSNFPLIICFISNPHYPRLVSVYRSRKLLMHVLIKYFGFRLSE